MNKNDKNVVSIEDRIPKLKEARKKKANRRLVFYMTIFFILISIIVYLQSPLSYVRTIEVEGNDYLTEVEVVEVSGLEEDANIWSLDFDEIEEELQSSTVIEDANVERKLPNTVVIGINEKQIIGFMEQDEVYYPLIDNGEMLTSREYSSFSGEAPLIIGFTDNEYLRMIASELSELPGDILDLISEIHWLDDDNESRSEVLFYMNDGYIVQGSIRDFADGMRTYPSVISQLDPDAEGIIHMGVGIYFEEFEEDDETDESEQVDEEVEELEAEIE